MPFLVRDCVRCGVKKTQMTLRGYTRIDSINRELFMVCSSCGRASIYVGQPSDNSFAEGNIDLESRGQYIEKKPITIYPQLPEKNAEVPPRVTELFMQAAACRRFGLDEAAGAIFRKTIDVATKLIYQTDSRLSEKKPASALRNRIKTLGELNVLDREIVEIADLAIVDGNDAAHDMDPYTSAEAESLEELTVDILDRIFVRPAKIARIKDKQIAAGQRKQET